ncbi:alpha/beta fold hydrolase [Georgenia daeguensis]|uniref:Alpha/beta hydrolase n=1 Tax=Georgenia daeguensis TaxID=908355 RepID=A0ABP8ETN6_9MICO
MTARPEPLALRPEGARAIGPAHALRSSVVRVRGTWTRVHRVADEPARPDGPVFVLLHGIGVSAQEFATLVHLLSTTGRVYALDLPGHGGLPRPRRCEPEIADLAAVVAEVLDAADVRSAVVVAHSMGAQVAVELLATRPDLVAGAVLISPVVDAAARRALPQGLRLAGSSMHETPRTIAVTARAYAACGVRWFSAVARAMLRYPVEQRMAQVLAPVVLMRGEHDAVAPERWLEALAGRHGDGAAETRTVPGAAHNVVADHAGAVARAALDVLARTRAGTA